MCGLPLTNISRLPVCLECLKAIAPISGNLCSVCGERLMSPLVISGADAPVCGLCRRARPPYEEAAAYGSYEGGLRDLIHLLKYERVHPAARALGAMLAQAIEKLQIRQAVVVPVPLHARKQRQRGYNQSELIARAALKATHASADFELATHVLERRRETQSQIGLSSHQRRENIRGAFAVLKPERIANREVLLVDDVFTTGTTASECARVLRRAGASKVYVATVARTLKFEAQVTELKVPGETALKMAAAG